MKYDTSKQTIYVSAYIYKLCRGDKQDDNIYIGSTVDIFSRLQEHKNKCKKSNTKLYKYIRENGGYENWNFIIIDKFDYKTKQDLILREAYHQELLKPTLNTNVAGGNNKPSSKYYKKRQYGVQIVKQEIKKETHIEKTIQNLTQKIKELK